MAFRVIIDFFQRCVVLVAPTIIPAPLRHVRLMVYVRILLAAVLTFCMTSCGEKNINKMEEVESEKNPETTYEEIVECYELDGPWHLDEKKFENVNFEDDFPGYAEWGSSMENQKICLLGIMSNNQKVDVTADKK